MRKSVADSKPAVEITEEGEVTVDGNVDPVRTECEALKGIIDAAHLEGVTLPEAEKYAARFLSAQMMIADSLKDLDLRSRMKKNGVKGLKAKTWVDAATKDEKKPSDKFLDSLVDSNPVVQREQDAYDRLDNSREAMAIYLGIFKDAHIYFRGIAKGKYE